MTARKAYVTLVGDMIGSREVEDRSGLQESLREALWVVNQVLRPPQPLEPTVGDEFQGVFADVGAGMRATLLVRLQLLKDREVDSRYGLGFGDVTVFEDRVPISQDGPGWWSARAAIELAKNMESDPQMAFVRTRFDSHRFEGFQSAAEVGLLNATLTYRDALIAKMRPRSRRLLLGMLLNKPQSALAREERISQSAVSQNLAASGAYAIAAADYELGRMSF
ncbi:MAG TPA: SatD family protein [Solirubrobacterales bacterium]|nr:SatD family protein [Solirubrobacterales bacterium]